MTPTAAVLSSAISRLLGREVPPQLASILGVGFVSTVASSSLNLLLGIWALQSLGASPAALGLAYAASAVASPLTGVAAGWFADKSSPRKALICFLAAQGIGACLLAASSNVAAFGLATFVIWQMSLSGVATVETVMGAHIPVHCDDETRFGLLRVAQNAGWILGPLAAAVVVAAGWLPLFGLAALFSASACVMATRLPDVEIVPSEEKRQQDRHWIVEMFRSPSFMVLLFGGLVGECAYVAFELLLPISLVSFHGFSKSEASLLLAVNPILILLLQVRVLGWLKPFSLRKKLCGSMTALAVAAGVMTLLPTLGGALVVVATFSVGEIVWVPAAQAAAAAVAPPERLGVYLGALSVTVSIAFGVAPWAGLAVQSSLGDAQMWVGFAALAMLASAIYATVSVSERAPSQLSESEGQDQGLAGGSTMKAAL